MRRRERGLQLQVHQGPGCRYSRRVGAQRRTAYAGVRALSSGLVLRMTHTQAVASAAASTCAAQMAAYKTATAAAMSTLESMCPGLDTCMSGMGHGDQADMMASVRDLRTKLDAHLSSGCSAANLASELARHQAAMLAHTDHLHTRTQSMMGMSTGGMMMVHDLDFQDGRFGRPETAGFGHQLDAIASAHREDGVRLERASAVLDDLHSLRSKRVTR